MGENAFAFAAAAAVVGEVLGVDKWTSMPVSKCW